MKIPAAHILSQFVDRSRETAAFESVLSGSSKRIMCISGPGGMGKSLLVSRLMTECEKRMIRWVYIEWQDSKLYSYLELMRRIREDTEPTLFQLFNDQVNFYTVPQYNLKITLEGGPIQNVHVLEGGEVQQSGVTVHVGHEVVIRDLNVNVPRPDRAVTDSEILMRLTEAFKPCLKALTYRYPLVVFLDALEKADQTTIEWIWKELLKWIREEEIPNLSVVLSGRNRFEPDPTFFDCAVVCELRPFQASDILAYLERRGLNWTLDQAKYVLSISEGNPKTIAVSFDGFFRDVQGQTNA